MVIVWWLEECTELRSDLTCVSSSPAPLSKLDRMQGAYLSGMKMIVKHTPYLWLVFGFLFCSVAFQVRDPVWKDVWYCFGQRMRHGAFNSCDLFTFQIAQGNFALFCTYVAGMGAYFQHFVLILLVSGLWVWQYMSLIWNSLYISNLNMRNALSSCVGRSHIVHPSMADGVSQTRQEDHHLHRPISEFHFSLVHCSFFQSESCCHV